MTDPMEDARRGYARRNGAKVYCCYGMYADIGHSADCEHALAGAQAAPAVPSDIGVDPISDAEQAALNAFTQGTPHYNVVRTVYRLASAHVNASPLPVGMTQELTAFTDRQWSIIWFAVHGFSRSAHEQAHAAAQDKDGKFFKPDAVTAFLKDAADAEELLIAINKRNAALRASSAPTKTGVDLSRGGEHG